MRTELIIAPGYKPYGAGYERPSLSIRDRHLTMSGLLGKTVAGWSHIGTLTEEHCPDSRLIFVVGQHHSLARLDVQPSGRIMVLNADNGYEALSLDGVRFSLDTGSPLELSSEVEQRSLNHGYRHLSWSESDGVVMLGGHVHSKSNVWRPNQCIATLPVAARPDSRLIFAVCQQGGMARVDVMPDGRVLWVFGGTNTSWVSLDGIVYHKTAGVHMALPDGREARYLQHGYRAPSLKQSGAFMALSGHVFRSDDSPWRRFDVIAVLEEGQRPERRLSFVASQHSRGARVDVLPDGKVIWRAGDPSCSWVNLDGVRFRTALGESTWGERSLPDELETSREGMKVLNLKQWMAEIPDSTRLSDLTIPGTHDAATGDSKSIVGDVPVVHEATITQDMSIKEQLNAGTRWLDLRVDLGTKNILGKKEDTTTLYLHHGSVDLGVKLKDVLDICVEFLDNNPQEVILLRMTLGSLKEKILSLLNHEDIRRRCYEPLLAPTGAGSAVAALTLGVCRGKIVLSREHIEVSEANKQNDWEGPTFKDKWRQFKALVLEAITNDTHTAYLNYASASLKWTWRVTPPALGLGFPKDYAEYMLPRIRNLALELRGAGGWGVIALDYADAFHNALLILTNSALGQHVLPPGALGEPRLVFTEDNDGLGDVERVIKLEDGAFQRENLARTNANDEIRSMQMLNVPAGTMVVVYDDSSRMKDDWATVVALEDVRFQTISSFENSDRYGAVEILSPTDGNLDGKISAIEVNPPPRLRFYSRENGEGYVVGELTLSVGLVGRWNLKEDEIGGRKWNNDEVSSVQLLNIPRGVQLRLYDDSRGRHSDDWCEIITRDFVSSLVVPKLERSTTYGDAVDVLYHADDNLKGKVSRIEVDVDYFSTNPVSRHLRDLCVGSGGHTYAVTRSGDLRYYGLRPSLARLGGEGLPSYTIGTGWHRYHRVIAGAGCVLYGIRTNGDLLYYRHQADPTRERQFEVGGVRIGKGWTGFRSVFAGGPGVLYGIGTDGSLYFYKHADSPQGEGEFSTDKVKIGGGWDRFRRVVSGGDGVLYAVTHDGELLYYRHPESPTGERQFLVDARKLSRGWDEVGHLGAAGHGILYAVDKRHGWLWRCCPEDAAAEGHWSDWAMPVGSLWK